VLCLPIYPGLTHDQLDRVIDLLAGSSRPLAQVALES
jgi:dTDP-4-amino-4,6-dideoxygalactose transaminase